MDLAAGIATVGAGRDGKHPEQVPYRPRFFEQSIGTLVVDICMDVYVYSSS